MPDPINYGSEIRIGVVMYGGVSLAIYINGVTNEMFELVRATQPNSLGDGVGNDQLRSRDVYARLSRLINNKPLREKYAELLTSGDNPDEWRSLVGTPEFACDCNHAGQPARFVIDVISGTSAGGINGIFLAKALANNEEFGLLRRLWIEEGDIGLLLNDKRSYTEGLDVALTPRGRQPKSLLNSDRMYVKLLHALRQMSETPKELGALQSLVDEVDLFVTTTDISGTLVSLKLLDKVVYERRHKQCFHFQFGAGGDVNDFGVENNAFLAFAARCTSSFPFAFEPMKLQSLVDLGFAKKQEDLGRWNGFFTGLSRQEVDSCEHTRRAFGDGAYLDNKPFSYVVKQLAERTADLPIERKLMYVEPSPEPGFESEGAGVAKGAGEAASSAVSDKSRRARTPNAVENAAAALLSIPQYETIREDLEVVLHRNRTVERIERIVRLGESDLEQQKTLFTGDIGGGKTIPDWKTLTMEGVISYYGRAFIPYFRLRVVTTTDVLAHALAAKWDIDRSSSEYQALRMLVWEWRERHYSDNGGDGKETIAAFLAEYDLDYRWRRLGFLLRKIDQTVRVINVCSAQGSQELAPEDMVVSKRLKSDAQWSQWFNEPDPVLDALKCLKRCLVGLRRDISLQRKKRVSEVEQSSLPEARRRELNTVLDVVLGADPTGKEVQSEDGKPIPLKLNAKMLNEAAAARGTQQAMYCRVQALYKAADGARGLVVLKEELERSVESLQLLGSSADDAITDGARALWTLLGDPSLSAPNAFGTARAPGSAPAKIDDPASKDVSKFELSCEDRASLDTPVGRSVRRFVSEYYLFFDSFDQISFPLYYDSGAGEPAFVDVVRISPRDATALVDERNGERKLDGTALANFGAFLDKQWRRNDILWGRLDGAERLIHAMLPMSDDSTKKIRNELTKLAQQAILRETFAPERSATLIQAFRDDPEMQDKQRYKELMAILNSALGDSERNTCAGVRMIVGWSRKLRWTIWREACPFLARCWKAPRISTVSIMAQISLAGWLASGCFSRGW
ncbi:MAG TPA: hypothetical protein DCR74_21445 [Achromobacter sp.]|nr:hypothetical protein [Achromobacter sp.]